MWPLPSKGDDKPLRPWIPFLKINPGARTFITSALGAIMRITSPAQTGTCQPLWLTDLACTEREGFYQGSPVTRHFQIVAAFRWDSKLYQQIQVAQLIFVWCSCTTNLSWKFTVKCENFLKKLFYWFNAKQGDKGTSRNKPTQIKPNLALVIVYQYILGIATSG